eukprot:CAMPEP_0176474732 /NCGR_PEP_ID=MMETSP0127-20121128/43197_1 /TAXON_ID=938130 /ORGANISM="Platyophrya macrostoma, Strain WH" /LENGTH=131 /DNA_ID=CAMNT_0017870215 /DNA_START=112 /DNA_END=503 /DNA_ORIENTATION=-
MSTVVALSVAESHRDRVSQEVEHCVHSNQIIVRDIVQSMDPPSVEGPLPQATPDGDDTSPKESGEVLLVNRSPSQHTKAAAATPVPFRTRAYLRPLSAVTSAAATHGATTPMRTPSKPVSTALHLVDRVTA